MLKRSIVSCVFAVALISSAFGQVSGGGSDGGDDGSTIGQLPADDGGKTTGDRFEPIISGVNVGGTVRQLSKTGSYSVALGDYANLYSIVSYTWSVDKGVILSGAGTSSVTAAFYDAGVHAVKATVRVVSKTNPNEIRDILYPSKSIYVVGGPLTISGTGGIADVPDKDAGGYTYLQYFGFDPSQPQVSGLQDPRRGLISAPGGQPSGTITYNWTAPSSTVIVAPVTNQNTSSLITIGATAGSSGSRLSISGSLSVHFVSPLTEMDDGTMGYITGDAVDDTQASQTSATAWKFSAHAPAGLDWASVTSNSFNMTLTDDGNAAMPGVWVANRTAAGTTPADASSTFTTSSAGTFTQAYTLPGYRNFRNNYYGGSNVTTPTSTLGQFIRSLQVYVFQTSVQLANYTPAP